jgi:hypothetical protein
MTSLSAAGPARRNPSDTTSSEDRVAAEDSLTLHWQSFQAQRTEVALLLAFFKRRRWF